MAEDKIIGLSLINKALPSGILEKVFKQLDNKDLNFAKLTCKHWKELIDKMTKPNLILHQAILENLKSVQHLIKEGENIEAKNSDGQTVGYPYKWQIWSIIVPIQGTSDIHERILKIPLEFL